MIYADLSALITESFSEVSDPRASNARHFLDEIFFLSFCAVSCGAESREDIELYGKSKYTWLKNILRLPHGIPSNDTYRRVFSAINPDEFERCFQKRVNNLINHVGLDIIAVDGKSLRHSFDSASSQSAIHMVSAWSSAHQLVLGQVKTESRSNEITAIPALLNLIDISGHIVTADAMGTQKKIARQILDQGGDYVLSLKKNHKIMYQEAESYFQENSEHIRGNAHRFYETVDSGHGRIETRSRFISSDIEQIKEKSLWSGLTSIGMVKSVRETAKGISTATKYYLCSISPDPVLFATAVRNHRGIENSLHWVLDVSFREDDSGICKCHAPQNFSLIRKIALTVLKLNKNKGSIKGKRKKAGRDNQFLLSLLRMEKFQMR